MKLRITVGEAEIRTEGIDLTQDQLVDLLREVAGTAVLIAGVSQASEDAEPRQHLGFTAHLELDPQRNDEPNLSEWFEDHP